MSGLQFPLCSGDAPGPLTSDLCVHRSLGSGAFLQSVTQDVLVLRAPSHEVPASRGTSLPDPTLRLTCQARLPIAGPVLTLWGSPEGFAGPPAFLSTGASGILRGMPRAPPLGPAECPAPPGIRQEGASGLLPD